MRTRRTLLAKAQRAHAKADEVKKAPTPEQLGLAVAWFSGIVDCRQVAVALGLAPAKGANSAAIYRMAVYLKRGVAHGLIKWREAP